MTRASALLGVLFAIAALAGCEEKQETPKPKLRPISASEEERGLDACTAYVERLCRCAEIRPELREKCELVRTARVESLRMALAASRSEDADVRVRWRTEITARRIMSRCIEEDNALDPALCPRPAPSPSR
jgi:hypothetical protein